MTTCTASKFGDHDYSAPPHATADKPRPLGYYDDNWETGDCCAASSAFTEQPCEHEQRYELVMFCIGTHEWITLRACAPCTASIRARHRPNDIHSIASLRSGEAESAGEQR